MSIDGVVRRLAPLALLAVLLGSAVSASGASVGPPPTDPSALRASLATPAPSAPGANNTAGQAQTAPVRRSPAVRARTVRAGSLPAVPVVDAGLRPHRAGAGTQPRRLEVAGVDIDLPVVPVGVTDDRAMQLPDSVDTVGWYRFGPRPADRRGTTVLAAHVDSVDEGLGPFAKLRWTSKGSVVAVTDARGDTTRFRVTSVQRVAKSKVALDHVFDRAGEPRVAIITCGGAYDQESGYRDNVIVTAEPES